MRALILAAGEGKRLRPFTDSVPKPMLAIGDRPILEHNVRLLATYDILDVTINLHHQPDAIVEHFGDGSKFGVNITYSMEPTLLGTGGAINNIRDTLSDTFLVLYGDNLTTCNLHDLLGVHRRSGAAATLAAFWREDVLASGILEFDDSGRIQRFQEKPNRSEVFSHWVNAGILALEPAIFKYISQAIPCDLSKDVFPAMLECGELLQAFEMKSGLWWIDTPEDYERTSRDFTLRS